MDSLFIVDIIKSVGFPIFVASYLLVSHGRLLKENTRAIRELKDWLRNNKGEK